MRAPTLTYVCPETKLPLQRVDLAEAIRQLAPRRGGLVPMVDAQWAPIEPSAEVLVRSDGLGAYPVRDGIPILLLRALLVGDASSANAEAAAQRELEAFTEMDHYSTGAAAAAKDVASSPKLDRLRSLRNVTTEERLSFPYPPRLWADTRHELTAQLEAYEFLRPIEGKRILQVGGRGVQAMSLVLAGAAEAVVLTPMIGELQYAAALAHACSIADRVQLAAAVAEEMPFADETFDAIYIQNSLHHLDIADAMPELRRVLRSGGRLAAVEPWRAPLYDIGIKVLGKRDRNVSCEVLTAARLMPHLAVFEQSTVTHHGALTRYVLIALSKLGIRLPHGVHWRIGRADDAISSMVPRVRGAGSCVSIKAVRAPGRGTPGAR